VSETNTFALLEDLARLLRKHGAAAFSDLAAFLRDPAKVDELTTILESSSSAGKKAKLHKADYAPSRRKTASATPLQFLSELKRTDPEKAVLLIKFNDDLSSKHILPSLRDLRYFASDNQLRKVTADSREKAIGPLIRELSRRTIEELSVIFGRLPTFDNAGDDRSLQRWTDVILNKKQTQSNT
jgi:hypothetical protein